MIRALRRASCPDQDDPLVAENCDELELASERLDISAQGVDLTFLEVGAALEPRNIALRHAGRLGDLDLGLTHGRSDCAQRHAHTATGMNATPEDARPGEIELRRFVIFGAWF